MNNAPARTVKDALTDFLGAAPTLEEIAAHRLPLDLQDRAHQLLDKYRDGSLTDEERAEMEKFRQMDHLITLVKAKARLHLKAQG
jgi:hypothetical protein